MKAHTTIPIIVSAGLLLTACGGESNTASLEEYTLSGTVPGTLIEAFCDDGSYHRVTSTKNGTDKHPFALNLPINISCRVLMTTNENDASNKVVTPIRVVSNKGTTSIAFSSADDVNLGHVDLALGRSEMKSDMNQDGVEDHPVNVQLDTDDSSKVHIDTRGNDPMDSDGDGIINVYEDDDNDHIPNKDDDDDDGNGVLDKDEEKTKPSDDHDKDGIKDKDDVDDDNDGVEDSKDSDPKDDKKSGDRGHDKDKDKDDDKDKDKDDDKDNGNGGGNTNPTVQSAGRLLASQCFQCHGSEGVSKTKIDSLAGESRNEIIEELTEMQGKNKNEIMHLQAKGYSAEQIRLIADYFAGNTNKGGN